MAVQFFLPGVFLIELNLLSKYLVLISNRFIFFFRFRFLFYCLFCLILIFEYSFDFVLLRGLVCFVLLQNLTVLWVQNFFVVVQHVELIVAELKPNVVQVLSVVL